jgi:hypothetical protein
LIRKLLPGFMQLLKLGRKSDAMTLCESLVKWALPPSPIKVGWQGELDKGKGALRKFVLMIKDQLDDDVLQLLQFKLSC